MSIVRAARAAVFAAVCMVLTVTGHSVATGHQVAPSALGAGFVAAFGMGLAVGGRERSQGAITLCVYAGQLGLHLLFGVGVRSHPVGVEASAMAATMNHMSHLAGMPGMPGSGMPGMAAHSGLAMVLTHLGAGTVAGWWLRGGETACWRLLRRMEATATATLRAAVRRILAGPELAPVPDLWCRSAVLLGGLGSLMSVRLARCSPRRGPPNGVPHLPSAH
jgi:hypothetical protein